MTPTKWALVQILVAPFPVQFPAGLPRKAADDTSAWAPVVHVGDLDGVLGSRLQHGPALATEAIWRID